MIAVAGLYLLCIKAGFFLQTSDLLLLICSVCFALHILVIDHFSPLVDGVRMSCIQFLVCGIIGPDPRLFQRYAPLCRRDPQLERRAGLPTGLDFPPLRGNPVLRRGLYPADHRPGGLKSAVASLLMSLESVFSVLAGWAILHQTLSARELGGCALLFAAILLAQVPVGRKRGQAQMITF